jgi:hypothetical protein
VTLGYGRQLERADEFVDLYHGTTKARAASIRENGIDLSKSRPVLDFGPGFYTTRILKQAQDWGAEVLHFRVPRASLEHFQAKNFSSAGSDWADFVRMNRSGGGMHGYDIVSGPVLKNIQPFLSGRRPVVFGDQMSFHTQSVIDLLNGSLVKR